MTSPPLSHVVIAIHGLPSGLTFPHSAIRCAIYAEKCPLFADAFVPLLTPEATFRLHSAFQRQLREHDSGKPYTRNEHIKAPYSLLTQTNPHLSPQR